MNRGSGLSGSSSRGLKRGSGLSGGGLRGSRKRINPYGAIAKERAERKKQWEADHPPLEKPSGEKYYLCHICNFFGESKWTQYVSYERYVLEHIMDKNSLTLEESQRDENLAPSHVLCNTEKGSQRLWEMDKSPKSGKPNPGLERFASVYPLLFGMK